MGRSMPSWASTWITYMKSRFGSLTSEYPEVLSHFDSIALIHGLSASAESWRRQELHPGEPLPSWLMPIRLLVHKHQELKFCLAIVSTHVDDSGVGVHEAPLELAHETRLDDGPLRSFLDARSVTRKLAILQGLRESYAAGQQNRLALYRRIGGAKYWVLSHISKLCYAGWALDNEKLQAGYDPDAPVEEPCVVQIENGARFVLGRNMFGKLVIRAVRVSSLAPIYQS
ncbi:Uncharacterized protein TPAR_08671 [Tolypocladium paradoxum]|uniref:Uncharacterized protein n=1 Tax=Tolypocladium paradoxum TaxID=94208 RepID=A0A2S4KLM8_9HYPO|nr:Uncharacterized protein TPAR_08671 [Tolypocladium paradoxum]